MTNGSFGDYRIPRFGGVYKKYAIRGEVDLTIVREAARMVLNKSGFGQTMAGGKGPSAGGRPSPGEVAQLVRGDSLNRRASIFR